MSDRSPREDRFLITFETWAEHLPDNSFDLRIVGHSDEYRLRPSVEGVPDAQGLPEFTDIFGSNITDIETLDNLDAFYTRGYLIAVSVSAATSGDAWAEIVSIFPDARLASGEPEIAGIPSRSAPNGLRKLEAIASMKPA